MIVQDLTKKYDGKAVVDSVSFEIPKGKVISLIGPNGAGKSTVMGIISRLIARDGGLVDFKGTDIAHWKSKELAKRLAILTQTNNIQMKLTVRELVTFGRFPLFGQAAPTPEDEAIDRSGHRLIWSCEEFEDRFIDELSGGQTAAGLHRHGHRAGYGICAARRAHQQPGHLPRLQDDADGAAACATSWARPSSWCCMKSTTRRSTPTISAPLPTGKLKNFGTVRPGCYQGKPF